MDTNLVRRIAAAIVLAPAAVAAVLWLPSAWFAVAAALFVSVGSWEWAGLSTCATPGRRLAYAALTLFVMVSLYLSTPSPDALLIACAVGAAWWGAALIWVVRTQRGSDAITPPPVWLHLLCGWMVLVPAFSALVLMHMSGSPGRWWILLLLAIVWGADIGAFFAGRRFGRHRLASRLSPGKSWEGALGGTAAALGIGVGAALIIGDSNLPVWTLAVLSAGAALVSILGDLTESLVKRQAGVKDSGALIPGHGGVLDRIDSLCAAAPCFALAVAGLFGTEILR